MMDERLLKGFQAQLGKELYSAYLYLAMANYLEWLPLGGLAHWMKMQALEEFGHAEAFRTFIRRRHEFPKLPSIKKPPELWNSYRDPFEEALEHEEMITESIMKLYNKAQRLGDAPAVAFLELFNEEQQEELEAAQDAIVQVNEPSSERELRKVDLEMGRREAPGPFPVDWTAVLDAEW